VAFSGGADSTALLLAAARRWPGQVTALHVHHGLQAAADEFVKNCTAVCAPLGVPLQVLRVDARHRSGQSPEDAARNSRYRALALAAQQAGLTCVLLGQHADDQVETLLLALGRGAGLPGLSAMPAQFERSGMRFYRPLLQTAGSDLRQWLERQGVAFVDDPSNADERFTRNRLRARVLPALQDALPQFRQTFARSARHAAQAQTLLDELAAEDLLRVGKPPAISALQLLSKARQANVLRHWLASVHQVRPSAAQLEQLLAQIQACRTRGHRIHLKVAAGHVRLDAGALSYTGLAPDGPGA
jgi:tRNA(Ile)-lysidine synthase